MEMPSEFALAAAKRMRREPVAHERIAWRLLRDRRLADLKFRRQVAIGRYVADYVCFAARLIVEFDGPEHDPAHDETRDEWLESQNFVVLRFPNEQLANYPDAVLGTIRQAAEMRR